MIWASCVPLPSTILLSFGSHFKNFEKKKIDKILKMWLTRILLSRSTPGRIHGGKHRLLRKITSTQVRNTRDRQQKISHVEALLTTPYLTLEEEHGHTSERKKQEREEFLLKRRRSLGPNVYASPSPTLVDKTKTILSHLEVSR